MNVVTSGTVGAIMDEPPLIQINQQLPFSGVVTNQPLN